MKKILSLMVAAMLGLSSASAQALLTEPEESFVEQNRESSIENQGEIQDVSFPMELADQFFSLSNEERAEKIDLFLVQYRKYLPANKTMEIKEALMGLNENQLKSILYGASDEFHNPSTVLLVSILLPIFTFISGVDRMMIGDVGLGILKLVTLGGLGVWTIVDWFIIKKRTRSKNYEELMSLIRAYQIAQ